MRRGRKREGRVSAKEGGGEALRERREGVDDRRPRKDGVQKCPAIASGGRSPLC